MVRLHAGYTFCGGPLPLWAAAVLIAAVPIRLWLGEAFAPLLLHGSVAGGGIARNHLREVRPLIPLLEPELL